VETLYNLLNKKIYIDISILVYVVLNMTLCFILSPTFMEYVVLCVFRLSYVQNAIF